MAVHFSGGVPSGTPVNPPPNSPINDGGYTAREWAQFFNMLAIVAADASRSGTTDQRPTTNLYAGKFFFDTTINKPIWWNPFLVGWVLATGAAA